MDARLFLENSTVCQIVDAIWLVMCWCVCLWVGVLGVWWVLVEMGAMSVRLRGWCGAAYSRIEGPLFGGCFR